MNFLIDEITYVRTYVHTYLEMATIFVEGVVTLHCVVVRTPVDTYNVVYYLTINTRAYVVTTNAAKRRLRTYVPVVEGIYSSRFHIHPSIGGSF